MPKRVAFYVRVSTDGQTVENQLGDTKTKPRALAGVGVHANCTPSDVQRLFLSPPNSLKGKFGNGKSSFSAE